MRGALALMGIALASAVPAQALITPPVTVDGPSSQILDFGGVSMAADGTGGLVYLKAVEGIPHIFASRYVGGEWTVPIRVDWDQPFAASQPQIAAGPKGALLVVWVTGVSTVHHKVQYGLFSSKIGTGASSFGPSLVVDPNVGGGVGVDPSLVAATAGKAIVAYRAITYDFNPNSTAVSTAVQLRPGDVMADVRVARLAGDRWSRLGAMNRNPEASMRPPSPTNGPQIGAGAEGNAVLAWQEPDQTGTARIWMRRIFGSTPGPIQQASPSSWGGKPVSADADAFSLSVTPYAQAQVAMRIGSGGGSVLANRLLLNSLSANYSTTAGTLSGPQLADGGFATPGPPDVAVTENQSNRSTSMRLDFVAGSRLWQMELNPSGGVVAVPTPAGPRAPVEAQPVAAVDPEGGGLVAYPAFDPSGLPAVAVRQEFPSGAAQTGLVSGVQGGPISGLSIGRSGIGDGLVVFRQGEPGRFEIVAERVSAPPSAFSVKAPKAWSKPNAVKLSWQAAQSAVGGIRYSVLVDGRVVRQGLRGRVFHPRPAQLGNGKVHVRVLATDGLGEQLLSGVAKLRVDGQKPLVRVRAKGGEQVVVNLSDADSGVKAKATRIDFGDGSRDQGGAKFAHSYATPGTYTVVVGASDNVGNRLWRRFEVRVR